ncbi:2-methylisocitrate lyase [Virgisporangium aliadipatigenens]|uniref:2-methylisocitrate lyase n=2 Tax=Virgisporangium aliadipatigenens TaxID=741659 RepID=A0A8J3YNF4_9ACTN|nr:2-methylisocitrate lyase [Virgisporangium aliadipatigenens]
MHVKTLILPNAWDPASARVIEEAGAAAIATTSAGVSWAHGRADGQTLTRDEMLGALARIVAAVEVPVSADIEQGYDDVAATVRAVVDLGIAGVNLEDGSGEPAEHAERLRTARAAGGDLVINARTDVYLAGIGEPEGRFDETVARARLYLAAGADVVFVPGVVDEETIALLAKSIDGPLNVMAWPGAPSPTRLAELGVARISVGPVIAMAAYGAARRAAEALLERGDYGDPERFVF